MDTLFSTGHLALWLLVGGLFFPRWALFFAWMGNGTYPASDMPGLLGLVMWLAMPRFLLVYYIFENNGAGNVWFWAYLLSGLWTVYGKSKYSVLKRANSWQAFYRKTRAFKGCDGSTFDDAFDI